MNLPCEIVKDLLVLYADDALGNESHAAVEEHLKNCPDCSKVLESIRQEKEITRHQEELQVRVRKYQKRVKKEVRIIVISLIAFFLIGGWWWFSYGTTGNPNIFETTSAYFQLYVMGADHVLVHEEPLTIYCESRYEIDGTRQKLSKYGFEYTGKMDGRKRSIMIKDDELYAADIHDNRFIACATVTKGIIPVEGEASILEEYHEKQNEVSTGQ